jgi:hypothetical protein
MATAFNLGGLLGINDGLGDLLTPEQQRAVQQRGLLSAAAALLQASGPSATRTNLGQALGSALLAGQTGAEQAQQSALTQMLTRQKVEEARQENAANRAFQQSLERLRPSAMASPAAPTGEQQLAEFGIPVEPMPVATRQAPGARQLTNAQIDLLRTLPRKEAASELLKMIQPQETEKTRQLRELGLEPTLANLQLLDQPEKIRLMQSLGLQPNVANLRLLEKPEAAPEKIRTLQSLGLEPTIENLRLLDQPGVEPEKIRTLRALNLPLTLENFRALDKPDQTPERIRILQALGIEPTEANLRRFERKPEGQPQRVTELASGRQVLMQQFSDGTYETVGGFGPPRQLERVDLGGRIQFVDMNAVQPGSALAKSLAPQVVGGAESGYFVVGGGGGGAAPRPAAGAPAPARPPAAAGAPVAPAPAGAAPAAAPAAVPTRPAAAAPAAPAPAAAPALPAGVVPLIPGTGKGFEKEKDLRSEFDKAAKPFTELAQAFQKIETAAKNPSGAGDISLVYGYMKVLDPGSVVREGEFATAANAGGVPDTIRSLYNRAIQGERLSDRVREDFLGQARNLIESQRVLSNDLVTRFQDLARQYQLNPDRVTADPFRRIKTPEEIMRESAERRGGQQQPAAQPAPAVPTSRGGFFERFNLIPR